jgi:transcriptional regulator with XRE-family HTH domain
VVASSKMRGLWLAPELPVLDLVLAWRPRDGRRPRTGLHPRALWPSRDELVDWTDAATLGGLPLRREDADGTWSARARRLPVGLALAVVPAGDAEEPAPAPRRGSALRRAREAAGLSVRELARRAGLSAQTLSGAESGRTDPRLSSLLALCEALPRLSCWSLLPWPAGTPAERALLEWSAAAFGCVVEEEHKEVELSASGSLRIRIHFHGLRRLRPERSELSIVLGAAKTVLQRQAAELDEVSEDEPAGLRIARLGVEPGPAQFVIRIPAETVEAPRGVSFTRRFVNPGSHAMTAERAREITGQDGPFHEGTIMGPLVPARRSVLSVRFPRGYRPLDLRASAWAMNQAPDPEGEDLAPRLGEAAPRLEWDARRRTARVESESLPLGFKLALSWRLP